MDLINDLLQNEIFICGCVGWLTAQVLKTFVHFAVNRTFDIRRLVGDGGMPSAHSATVTAMAVKTAIIFGVSGYEFAIAAMLAIIVMHDAMGVRMETGKQAKIIKEMASFIETLGKDISDEEKLKEFVGHTFSQVVAGALLGVIIAFVI